MHPWRARLHRWFAPVARRSPLSPNAISLIALLLNAGAATLLYYGARKPILFLVAIVVITIAGYLVCLLLAELSAMMPDRSGGLPSYAYPAYKEKWPRFAEHVNGFTAWAYWLGWFPVAPLNMILASFYIVDRLLVWKANRSDAGQGRRIGLRAQQDSDAVD